MILTPLERHFIDLAVRRPLKFISDILKVRYLTAEQCAIVKSVWKNKYTGVKAAHNVGKTFIEACIVLTFVTGYKNSLVITTAPTARQVRDLLWAEINRLYNDSLLLRGMGKMNLTSYTIDSKWYATGIATEAGKEEQSAVKFQGYHAKKILAVLDEAVGIHPSIWEAIDGITSSANAKVLAVGNPSMLNCAFKKHLDRKDWNTMNISALNHPNVTSGKSIIHGAISRSWVSEKIESWCEKTSRHNNDLHTFEFGGNLYKPNSLFQWKVLGEFPDESTDSLIAPHKVHEAMNRTSNRGIVNWRSGEIDSESDNITNHPNNESTISPPHYPASSPSYMSIDAARFGSDYSVFAVMKDNHIRTFPYFHLDIAKLSGQAIQMIRKYKPSKVAVDCDGLGAGVYDNLNEARSENRINCELIEIHGGANPLPLGQTEDFLNLRAQMYWLFKLDIDTISLEQNDEMEEGLSTIKYFFNSKGKIQIESKDDIKRRLGRSPDLEDAAVYCNFMRHLRLIDGYALQEEINETPYKLLSERIGV